MGAEGATYVSNVRFAGASIQALVEADAAAADDDKLTYLFIADATTMADAERKLIAVDLFDEPGRTFRLPTRWYADVSANLSIALAEVGYAVRSRHAQGSHIIAVDVADAERTRIALQAHRIRAAVTDTYARFGFHYFTTSDDVDRLRQALSEG
ncbi:DUF6924 domain-containing protein [Dactylosporangium sucinum]|uniref:DUF6924 domain-containing protein n=1 Tax=Dactylosporangium sucinum TaxID=1424081 RepID=UPI0035711F75